MNYYKEYTGRLSTLDWKEFTTHLKNKAEWKCQACGKKNNLHCHHMTYEYLNHPLEWMSIMVLCKDCHDTYHKIYKHPPLKTIDRLFNINHHLEVLKNEGVDTSWGEKLNHLEWADQAVMSWNQYTGKKYDMGDVSFHLREDKTYEEKIKSHKEKFDKQREELFDPMKYIQYNENDAKFFNDMFDFSFDLELFWVQERLSKYGLPKQDKRPKNWRKLVVCAIRKCFREGKLSHIQNPETEDESL